MYRGQYGSSTDDAWTSILKLQFKGSRSHPEKPTGMTEEKENYLREKGNLFQEPDSTLLLSSGCGRHWPDARGESLL